MRRATDRKEEKQIGKKYFIARPSLRHCIHIPPRPQSAAHFPPSVAISSTCIVGYIVLRSLQTRFLSHMLPSTVYHSFISGRIPLVIGRFLLDGNNPAAILYKLDIFIPFWFEGIYCWTDVLSFVAGV